ncbi:hypothetical protein DXG03_007601 [Asterophora parasitica]|uniref:Metallo-dependent hydrolase n=1 Tax=Asterophora parasitica TaxID=117018 RepID=A0A9P7K911_9AGAR|nr:hypothetical protein DXG03_007601 [Asterophora parasitica]
MAKKKSNTPPEDFLLLPAPPSTLPIIDTHTHLASTFEAYRTRYPGGRYTDVHEFVKGIYEGRNVLGVVDVWCEAPVQRIWREFADAAWGKKDSGALDYRFVIGVHPHEARHYNDDVERDMYVHCPHFNSPANLPTSLEALSHPSNVGLGEIGLDYHYDLSPHDFQQDVFRRQLRHAIRLGKPLTIHTREAEGDTERILKEEVPREHKVCDCMGPVMK